MSIVKVGSRISDSPERRCLPLIRVGLRAIEFKLFLGFAVVMPATSRTTRLDWFEIV